MGGPTKIGPIFLSPNWTYTNLGKIFESPAIAGHTLSDPLWVFSDPNLGPHCVCVKLINCYLFCATILLNGLWGSVG